MKIFQRYIENILLLKEEDISEPIIQMIKFYFKNK